MGLNRYSTRLTNSKIIVRTDCSNQTGTIWVTGASNISRHSSGLITRAASTCPTTRACRMSTSDQWNRNNDWNEHVACWNRVDRVSLEERDESESKPKSSCPPLSLLQLWMIFSEFGLFIYTRNSHLWIIWQAIALQSSRCRDSWHAEHGIFSFFILFSLIFVFLKIISQSTKAVTKDERAFFSVNRNISFN